MLLSLLLVFSISSQVFAEIRPLAEPIDDMTYDFSKHMRDNAAYIAYFAYTEQRDFGTYPFGTGFEFAEHVKPGGDWDYKTTYGYSAKYKFNGLVTTGEDFGNIHYAYVGRAAGFSELLLKSAAGAVQIYAGTSQLKWYATFFDDPTDQAAIQRGFNYWTNKNLPNPYTFRLTDETKALIDTLTDQEKQEIRKRVQAVSEKIKNNEELSPIR
ncbi:polymorphic toxin type 44 domain-containing protein [Paenibacillus bouchesdurhonensis]|uniref:polymorphic toxin type 44 domain-containing protein n=1 Tax=Paenibacillus bouchesdurhonensis TaxID=1870990 RepID=UPI000DA612BE|nr:polymorphic toxin type 44 domain-containing protein [Paenibacillus bouchesdurhonensis]